MRMNNFIERTKLKYETFTDLLSDKIQHLPQYKRIKYDKLT